MKKYIGIIVAGLILCITSAYADIERISVTSIGAQANSNSYGPSLSADGRYVAFQSYATNLANDDISDVDSDVYVHDRQTGLTEIVSVSSSGERAITIRAAYGSTSPSISADGSVIAFQSFAYNLVDNDTNDTEDVFVHDRNTGVTERVSVSSNGAQGNRQSRFASISPDGRFVAYTSYASNLVNGDTNEVAGGYYDGGDVFIHDRQTGMTERVSLSSNGEQGNGLSQSSSLSIGGRYVAFQSFASNLVEGDTNDTGDAFVHDRVTRITERISVSSSGAQANNGVSSSVTSEISADGRFVAFSSYATNLVAGDNNGKPDLFVYDRQTGVTERVSVSSNGVQVNGIESSYQPSISTDGRFVTFHSRATNLVERDWNGEYDVFIHDRESKVTQLISLTSDGIQGDSLSNWSAMSADGRFIGFQSDATNLVIGDTNDVRDVFVTNNPLLEPDNTVLTVEKLINNESRETIGNTAKLSTATLYRQSYKVTNASPNRIYQVKVFENGNLVCNFFALNPGQSRQRCDTFQIVLDGEQHVRVDVTAKVSGSGEALASTTDAYYTGLNVSGELRVTHRINNVDADGLDQATELGTSLATLSYKVENTGAIELYQVKTYHDPVSPVNSGWSLQCVLGALKPGQVRYCKRDISVTESGINQAMGRVQGRNAIRSAKDVVNASNPTYFIVP